MQPFNIQDRSTVQEAQSAGLSYAREIAEALCQSRIQACDDPCSPIVTAQQHDLYLRLVEEFRDYGSSKKTAENAAIDFVFCGLGADSSPHIRACHQHVFVYGPLQTLYERVFASLDVLPYIAERAATDAARGLGARDSEHIRMAQQMVNGQQIALTQPGRKRP